MIIKHRVKIKQTMAETQYFPQWGIFGLTWFNYMRIGPAGATMHVVFQNESLAWEYIRKAKQRKNNKKVKSVYYLKKPTDQYTGRDPFDDVYFYISGNLRYDTEKMAARLLDNHILHICTSDYMIDDDEEESGQTAIMFANANDLFGPGADCVDVTEEDIPSLYQAWKHKDSHSLDMWLCKKERKQPMFTIREKMKNDGVWDDELDSLP